MDFAQQQLAVGEGPWQDLKLSHTRHPVLEVTPAWGTTNEDWQTPELAALRERLLRDPYSLALLQEALAAPAEAETPTAASGDGDESEDSGSSEAADLTGYVPDDEFLAEAARWPETFHEEADRLWDDIGLPAEAFKEASLFEHEDSTGSLTSGESLSESDADAEAFDAGSAASSEESEEVETDEYSSILVAQSEAEEELLTKGQRRRLLAATKEIAEAADNEVRLRRRPEVGRVPRPMARKRWRILELFTWTCMVSQVAFRRGWEYLEPITLPGWDLTRPSDVAA